jgi:hypothetical protein
MPVEAVVTLLIAGTAGVLIGIGRAISFARFGRALRAERALVRPAAEDRPAHETPGHSSAA